MSEIALIGADNRKEAVAALFRHFGQERFSGKDVAVKANYNSADPFPASTHEETLAGIVETLADSGAGTVTLAERSGMGKTGAVLRARGVEALAHSLGFGIVVIDGLVRRDFSEIPPDGLHWKRGFLMARVFSGAERVVQTCCLKTHRFGGHFTLSLKNSVGCIARRDPAGNYDYMRELHSSPAQRSMIAEINRFYRTDLVIMDATEGFVRGGPESGARVSPGLFLAGTDRVAIDAAGVALLRWFGSTGDVMKGPVFGLGQIARAAEIGVGVTAPEQIGLIPLDEGSRVAAAKIREILDGNSAVERGYGSV